MKSDRNRPYFPNMSHIEAREEAKALESPKVIANTPVTSTPVNMTGFLPKLSAIIPQAKLEMRLPTVKLLRSKLE